jgi:hypothetical protein
LGLTRIVPKSIPARRRRKRVWLPIMPVYVPATAETLIAEFCVQNLAGLSAKELWGPARRGASSDQLVLGGAAGNRTRHQSPPEQRNAGFDDAKQREMKRSELRIHRVGLMASTRLNAPSCQCRWRQSRYDSRHPKHQIQSGCGFLGLRETRDPRRRRPCEPHPDRRCERADPSQPRVSFNQASSAGPRFAHAHRPQPR